MFANRQTLTARRRMIQRRTARIVPHQLGCCRCVHHQKVWCWVIWCWTRQKALFGNKAKFLNIFGVLMTKNLCNLWLKICEICGYFFVPVHSISTTVESSLQINPFYAKQTQITGKTGERKFRLSKGL